MKRLAVSWLVIPFVAATLGCTAARTDEVLAEAEAARSLASAESPSAAPSLRAIPPATLETLHDPSALRGANGLACHDRRLFVAQAIGGRISEVLPDGTAVPLETPPGMQGPDDLVFDEQGNLYVTDASSSTVWRRTASGGWSEIARELSGVNAIALAPGGHDLFVTECFLGDALLEIARDGGKAPRFIARSLGCPNAMSVTAAGDLVVPLLARGNVVRVDPATGHTTVIASQLRAPTAAKLAPDGSIVVLDGATGEIHVLPSAADGADGGTIAARLPAGIDNAVFCGESFLVSSFLTGEIHAFKPWPGTPRVLVKGGLVKAGGIAQGPSELLVSDGISIKRLHRGAAQVVVATVIDALPPPLAIAIGADGLAYVTVPFRGEVHRVDLGTREVSPVAEGLEWPTGIVALPDGDLLVAETGAGRITRVGRGGESEVVASGLMSPIGLARDGQRIYTAEPAGGRVLALREGMPPRVVASGLQEPIGVAVDTSGRVYVAEGRTGEIARIATDGTRINVADGFAFPRQTGRYPSPVPLLVDREGALVVASPEDGSVVRIVSP